MTMHPLFYAAPDLITFVALGGPADAQTGTLGAGVDPSTVLEFIATPTTANTGPMTLSHNSETPRPVLNFAGDPVAAGEWATFVRYRDDGAGNYRLTMGAAAAGGGAPVSDIVDANVNASAGIKTSKLAFSQDEADLTKFPMRSVYHRLRERISVMDPAPGNVHVADDSHDATPWFQEAIEYAETRSLKAVHVPAHAVSSYYKLGSNEIAINYPIQIIGEHPLITLGNQAGGLGMGEYIFKVDGTLFPNLEQVKFKNLSLRPDIGGTAGRGILLNRVAYPVLEDVTISYGTTGIDITGNRGYASHFERVRINGCSGPGMSFATFTGGGHHNFIGCSFNGNPGGGFHQTANSVLSGFNFVGCAWEGNAGRPFLAEGDIYGMQFTGCYAEKNTDVGGYTLGFVPASGKVQRGININGGIWETDAEAWPFLLGGAGNIRGFSITGVATDGYSNALVHTGAPSRVAGGVIQANFVQNLPGIVSGGPLTRTLIQNNEGTSGAVS